MGHCKAGGAPGGPWPAVAIHAVRAAAASTDIRFEAMQTVRARQRKMDAGLTGARDKAQDALALPGTSSMLMSTHTYDRGMPAGFLACASVHVRKSASAWHEGAQSSALRWHGHRATPVAHRSCARGPLPVRYAQTAVAPQT